MQTILHSIWWPRLATFALAALAAGSVAFWALKWPASSLLSVTTATGASDFAPTDAPVLARALGASAAVGGAVIAAAPANLAGRMTLVGIVANAKNGGAALISLDGKPARPYRVGARVDDGLVLQSVAPRRALLASGPDAPASVTLELPALKR